LEGSGPELAGVAPDDLRDADQSQHRAVDGPVIVTNHEADAEGKVEALEDQTVPIKIIATPIRLLTIRITMLNVRHMGTPEPVAAKNGRAGVRTARSFYSTDFAAARPAARPEKMQAPRNLPSRG